MKIPSLLKNMGVDEIKIGVATLSQEQISRIN